MMPYKFHKKRKKQADTQEWRLRIFGLAYGETIELIYEKKINYMNIKNISIFHIVDYFNIAGICGYLTKCYQKAQLVTKKMYHDKKKLNKILVFLEFIPTFEIVPIVTLSRLTNVNIKNY